MGDKDITIATFASVTGSDPGTARFYLEMNGWNLERATESFYDQGGVAVDPSLLDGSNLGSSGGGAGGKTMHVDLEVPIKGRPDDIGQHLQAGFSLLYKNHLFSDVVLNINGIEKYPAHKIVLCTWSEVFRALINGFSVAGSAKSGDAMDTKEREEDVPELQIDLEERLMSYFPLMLEYMYTGATKVSLTDVVYMIELASKFSVIALKDGCSDILFANSKEINYLLDIANKYGCSKLENQCANHIATHFENYEKSGEIMSLSPSTWEELLKSDDIEAYEEDIYVTMMIYVQKFNPPESYEVLERLLPWVRFPLMNDRFLEEQVAKNQLLQMIPITHELLHEAYRFKLHKSERTSTHRCKPRRPTLRWSKKDISTGLRLSDDQMTVTFPSSGGYLNNQWLSVVTETYITAGVHRFEFKINHCASNWLFVGVAGKNWKGWNDTASGYLGYGPHSWAYGCASGWGKASNMQHQQYGTPYKSGDVIRVTVDMDNKTIAFALNGKSFGTAFSNLESAVRPAVTLYQQSDSITLRRVFD